MGFRFAGDIWGSLPIGRIADPARWAEAFGQTDAAAAARGLPPIGSVAEGGQWLPPGGSVTIDGKVWTNPAQYGERYLTPADASGNRRITWGGQGAGSPRAKRGLGPIDQQMKTEAEDARAAKGNTTMVDKLESIGEKNRVFEAGEREQDRRAAAGLAQQNIAGQKAIQGMVGRTAVETARIGVAGSESVARIGAGAQNYATDATKEIEGGKLGLLREQMVINDGNADEDRLQSKYFFDRGLQAKQEEAEKDRRQDMLKWGLASLANGFAMLGGY